MKELSRKILSVLLVIAMLVPTGALTVQTSAEDGAIEIGDYITLGTYYGESIVWRCVDIDENGPLMLSDKILCLKAFDANGENSTYHSDGWGWIRKNYGSNCWFDSNIRQWLNTSGTVDFTHCSPTAERVYGGYNAYADEEGFLTEFTSSELSMIKTVTQKCYINSYETQRSGYWDGGTKELNYAVASPGKDYSSYYYQNVTDMIFFLNPCQVDSVYASFKDYLLNAYPTKQAVENSNYINEKLSADLPWSYWLGMAGNTGASYEHQYLFTNIGGTDNYSYEGSFSGSIGVRPAFYLNVDAWETEKLSDDAKAYIQQHVDFVNSNTYNNLMTNASFYNALWQYESTDRNFTAYTAWEVLGDIGEVASLSFDNLFVTDNPYDVILSDILLSFTTNNNKLLNSANNFVNSDFFKKTFNTDKIYNSTLKMLRTSSEWDDSMEIKIEQSLKDFISSNGTSLVDGIFFSSENYNFKQKHPQAYDILIEVIPFVSDNGWSFVFDGLDKFSTITDYINTGTDLFNSFYDAYQKYLIATTLVESQKELLNTLARTSAHMPQKARQKMDEAINSYFEVLNYDSAFSAVCNYMQEDSAMNVYKIFQGSLQKVVYNGIEKLLGVSVAGLISAGVFTYNAAYGLLGYASGLSESSEMFFVLDSAAKFENALREVVNSNADKLRSNGTWDNVTLFDTSWQLLQSVEQYSYSGLSKYISSIKRSYTFDFAIKTVTGGFFTKYFALKELNENKKAADNAIQVAVMFEGEWKNSSCHDKNSQVSKVVSVKCPTDVYVYDEAEKLVLSVVNNKIEVCDIYIAATVDGDEKIFALSDNGKYDIKIVGTDDGTMDYGICDLLNNEITEYTEFEDISLSKDCVYTGVLDDSETDYDLTLDYWVCKHPDDNHDGICDSCSEDFTKGCSCNCHSNSFMQFLHKILCFLYRIFGMEQYRYCGCGKAHW